MPRAAASAACEDARRERRFNPFTVHRIDQNFDSGSGGRGVHAAVCLAERCRNQSWQPCHTTLQFFDT
jgi:hypothetical protein